MNKRNQAGAAQIRNTGVRSCRICHKYGHGIRRCPKLLGPNNTRKVRNAAGMPRSKLRSICVKDVENDANIGDIYSLADGSLFVLSVQTAGPVVLLNSVQLRQRILWYFVPSQDTAGIDGPGVFKGPDSLSLLEDSFKCGLCKVLLNNPRTVACCGWTYCHLCIKAHLGKHNNICPSCGTVIEPDADLVMNQTLQSSMIGLRNHTREIEIDLPAPSNDEQFPLIRDRLSIGVTSVDHIDSAGVLDLDSSIIAPVKVDAQTR
eukprot:GHVH01004599.1.p1 GENE.GHVH01004599.1~~GHVH01004599.1.p1  ORF type:complete len:261 (+),score=20.71 GHVH01004599.1:368-1150(+)